SAVLKHAQRIVLAAEEPEVRILAKTTAPYGRDLVLDWKETAPELQITEPYQAKAVARGFAKKEDPALVVDYEVRFGLALRGRARPPDSALDVALPSDPWLMHWHVPAAERRHLRYFADDAITNPCADDDYADLPHPFYYWYDWQVDRHGPDADGKLFDCRK